MYLVTYDALKGFVDASVQGMEGRAVLAGDGAGDFGRRHCKKEMDVEK